MHDNIYNEFVLDTGTASGTDWVITMPTKRYYYNASNNVTKLFESNFRATGACDDILLTQYNREEQTVVNVPGFSPPSPTGTDAICWEANVITFNNTNVLLSANKSILTTAFPNGWVSLNFFPASVVPPVHQLIGGATIRTSTATGAAQCRRQRRTTACRSSASRRSRSTTVRWSAPRDRCRRTTLEASFTSTPA